jgi:hypothetical protein
MCDREIAMPLKELSHSAPWYPWTLGALCVGKWWFIAAVSTENGKGLHHNRLWPTAGHGKYNAQCYWGAMTTRNSHGDRTPHNNSYCSHLSVLLGRIYMTIALAHSLIFINAAKQRRASPQVAIGAQKHHHLEVHRQR